MATYSYILCTNCGGTGKSKDAPCSKCLGARMTGTIVDEHLYRILDIAACDVLELLPGEPVDLAQFA